MNEKQSRAIVILTLVLAVAVGSVVTGNITSSVGMAAAQETNSTDVDAGALIKASITAAGESVGDPVEIPGATFNRTFYRKLSTVMTAYNEEQPERGIAGRLVTGNIVNFHVIDDSGEEAVVSFRITEDNRITDLRAGPRDAAKIRMTTDRTTFDRITNARSPGTAFHRALNSDDIQISGRGMVSSIVWKVANYLRDIMSLL